jgi:hypothetical protein
MYGTEDVLPFPANIAMLLGEVVPLDPSTLASLYPNHNTYVEQMRTSIDEAVADGRLLPEDGAELLARAQASSVGTTPIPLPNL